MTEENSTEEKEQGVKPEEKDDPLSALPPEARKIFEDTQSGLLSALQKEREASKSAVDKLATIESESQSQLELQLQEQGKYKELAEKRARELADLQPKADQLASAQETLNKVLEAQIESIPESKRSLVPSYGTTEERLEWIAINRPMLLKAKSFDYGAGSNGGGETKKSVVLTPEQKATAKKTGVSEEAYAEHIRPKETP